MSDYPEILSVPDYPVTYYTKGPWEWGVMDYSTAVLEGPKGEEDHVMSSSPCQACQRGKTEWQWGRCATPSLANAKLIEKSPLLADLLIEILYYKGDAKNALEDEDLMQKAHAILYETITL